MFWSGHRVSALPQESEQTHLRGRTRLGSKVKGIQKGKRYAIQAFGGCAASIAKQHGIKITPGESAFEEYFSLPFFGLGANGGHAEYAVVDAQFLVPVVNEILLCTA